MKKADSSPYVCKTHKKLNFPLNIQDRIPWTEKQLEFFKLAHDKECKVLFVNGPAGTSKTLISVKCALEELNTKKVDQILYIRSALESADSKLGFLPGSASEKLSPYVAPLMDKLGELLPSSEMERLLKDGFVDAQPVGFLRGRHFTNKAIIIDESQCLTTKEMITILTRVGEFNKVFVCGDEMQSDLPGKQASGFSQIFASCKNDEDAKEVGIHTWEFDENDIVRGPIAKFFVKLAKNL